MCRPEHFGVTYAINPWMDPRSWARNHRGLAATSLREWAALYRTLLDLGAAVELIPAVSGLPDLVFTANAAVVLDRKVLLSRFRYPERRGEERHFEAAFRALHVRGFIAEAQKLPDGLVLEGAGDCSFDQARNLFWMGYGPRSHVASRVAVEQAFGVDVVALELTDARFYHIDTALCPLPHGEVLYVPGAFTAQHRSEIRERVAPEQRIELGTEDAVQLAANAVWLGDTLVLSGCGERLRAELEERGYRVVTTPLGSFLRSGGAAFCLTLRLDRRSTAHTSLAASAAA